jgi:hypothetical protein
MNHLTFSLLLWIFMIFNGIVTFDNHNSITKMEEENKQNILKENLTALIYEYQILQNKINREQNVKFELSFDLMSLLQNISSIHSDTVDKRLSDIEIRMHYIDENNKIYKVYR